MVIEEDTTHVLLLVEDNPSDAELVLDLLHDDQVERQNVIHVTRLGQAVEALKARPVDVILLDLRLPDASGLETLAAVRSATRDIPVVVLTGSDDDDLAIACIKAGAQDYLCKSDLKPVTLRRVIGYAINRQREAQAAELRRTLEGYRAMSSSTSATPTTAALAGAGAIAARHPRNFGDLVRSYRALLVSYGDDSRPAGDDRSLREAKERIVTILGDIGGGPRDLLDIHVAALDSMNAVAPSGMRGLLFEGRLLALEMMGILVDYYRVGRRRRSGGEAKEAS